MVKKLLLATLVPALTLSAAEPPAKAEITIDCVRELGVIKPMNGVNNGPTVSHPAGDQVRGNFEAYRAARIPFARTHDSINCVASGHCCDISAIFPDFDADENDPKNYDFVSTDHYLDAIRRAGTEIFFRLGQTIEHGPKKYGVLPPKDFEKWARIAEHVVRHYNEGWGWGTDTAPTTRNIAWSNQFNVVYWEIWNEPDLDAHNGRYKTNPRCWGGTPEEFYRFFGVVAKHLKSTFPTIKVGGPAPASGHDWLKNFIVYCRDNEVPLDFYSWHRYSRTPERIVEESYWHRKLLDDHGFKRTIAINDEWNYVKGWVDDWLYSIEVETGRFEQKGAAYVASVMIDAQSAPIDIMMYYDARANCSMNGLFNRVTLEPLRAYYAFYAWAKLIDLGTQVKTTAVQSVGGKSDANTGAVEKKDAAAANQFHAVAAKGADGSLAVMISRYSDDNNVSETSKVTLRVDAGIPQKAVCHLTDSSHIYTEIPLAIAADGTMTMKMQPNSFALVELKIASPEKKRKGNENE